MKKSIGKRWHLLLLFLVLLVVLSACGNNPKEVEDASKVTFTPTPLPTNTPEPTNTPTATPTPTVSPTPTLTPVADPTTTPTQAPDYARAEARYEETEEERAEALAAFSEEKTQPVLYVTTRDQRRISKKKYETVVLDLTNCEEEYAFSGVRAEMKVRGNSTAGESPYPYRIRFEKKQNVLGLHDGMEYRSWVLLKPTWNLVPDYVAHRIARAIFNGEYYASDGIYVNLIMDGEDIGLYYLCEQNQVAKGRIDVNEPKKGDTSVLTGYLLELDNNAGEDPSFHMDFGRYKIADWKGEVRKPVSHTYSIKSNTYSEAQREFIENYFKNVWEIVFRGCVLGESWGFDAEWNLVKRPDVTPEEAVGDVVDLQSIYDMIILQELCQDYDVGAGSMYYCVDFSENATHPKLTIMSPWDFNWGYQEEWDAGYFATTWLKVEKDGWDRSNVWFIAFMDAEWFRNNLYREWDKLLGSGRLGVTINEIYAYIEEIRYDVPADVKWRVSCGKDVVAFVENRITYLTRHWLLGVEE